MSYKDSLDKYIAQHQEVPEQLQSGFFDIGQLVAMALVEDSINYDEFIVSTSFDHKYSEEEPFLTVTMNIDRKFDDDRTSTTESITKFSEEEVRPMVEEVTSRWREMVIQAETTRTR